VQAVDLSEDRSVLSTQNDEIIISIFTDISSSEAKSLSDQMLPLLIFDSSNMVYKPPQPILLNNGVDAGSQVWICLTELDDDGSEQATHQLLKTGYSLRVMQFLNQEYA
jgi:hypothetical protein